MSHVNLTRFVELYFSTVKELRRCRKVLRDNPTIFAEMTELNKNLTPRQRRYSYTYKFISAKYGDLGKEVLHAKGKIQDLKHELFGLRPTIRLIQCILHNRLNEDEKEVLLDFLSNPRGDIDVPPRLIGLAHISPKLMSELLWRVLTKNI